MLATRKFRPFSREGDLVAYLRDGEERNGVVVAARECLECGPEVPADHARYDVRDALDNHLSVALHSDTVFHRVVAADAAEVGMPGTYYIGSDTYAVDVVAVERYKGGARAGRVKAIQVGFRRDAEVPMAHYRVERFARPMNMANRFRNSGESGSVSLGRAREYRDPSF